MRKKGRSKSKSCFPILQKIRVCFPSLGSSETTWKLYSQVNSTATAVIYENDNINCSFFSHTEHIRIFHLLTSLDISWSQFWKIMLMSDVVKKRRIIRNETLNWYFLLMNRKVSNMSISERNINKKIKMYCGLYCRIILLNICITNKDQDDKYKICHFLLICLVCTFLCREEREQQSIEKSSKQLDVYNVANLPEYIKWNK